MNWHTALPIFENLAPVSISRGITGLRASSFHHPAAERTGPPPIQPSASTWQREKLRSLSGARGSHKPDVRGMCQGQQRQQHPLPSQPRPANQSWPHALLLCFISVYSSDWRTPTSRHGPWHFQPQKQFLTRGTNTLLFCFSFALVLLDHIVMKLLSILLWEI